MATRIDDFRSKLKLGGARASQFMVEATFPRGLNLSVGDVGEQIKFLCNATTLPASTITPIEVFFRGRSVKLAGERQFQNWNIRIINDADFKIRKVMEAWSQKILEHGSTNGAVNPLSYTSDLTVTQLQRDETPVRTYNFRNCFPIVVSEIGLDFSQNNNIEEFTVEFSVDYWDVTAGDTLIT